MKDLTTTPTADLIAEWENLDGAVCLYTVWADGGDDLDAVQRLPMYIKGRSEIAAELDRRADELGLFIVGGCFVYAKCVNGDGPYRNWYGVVNPADWVRVTAKEQYTLEGWLLLKEGGGNA